MNPGKLDRDKQEMARLNTDILGISELKWTEMGEFNSYDQYIYYCGQESLRRNEAVHVKQFFNDHQSIRNSTTVLPNGNIKSSMSTFWRIFLKVTLQLEVAILISWTVLYFCFQSIASCFPGTLIH